MCVRRRRPTNERTKMNKKFSVFAFYHYICRLWNFTRVLYDYSQWFQHCRRCSTMIFPACRWSLHSMPLPVVPPLSLTLSGCVRSPNRSFTLTAHVILVFWLHLAHISHNTKLCDCETGSTICCARNLIYHPLTGNGQLTAKRSLSSVHIVYSAFVCRKWMWSLSRICFHCLLRIFLLRFFQFSHFDGHALATR